MDAASILIFLTGALIAGAGAFVYLRKANAAELAKRSAEAQARAAELERQLESSRLAAEKAALEAENARRKAEEEVKAARRKAQLDTESAKRSAEIEARELALKARQEAEAAVENQRKELKVLETRLSGREEGLERKLANVEERERELGRRDVQVREFEAVAREKESTYDKLVNETRERLEKVAGLSSEEAKMRLIEELTEDARSAAAQEIRRLEEEAESEAEARAKRIVGIAIQRYAGEYTTERTVSTVHLASEEMKGRIIGREGRNIRALEAATGIDFIIDDTPEAITLSGYHPVRREVARRAIDALLKDGRIHPAKIEEAVAKAEAEVESSLKEYGEQAMFELGLTGMHHEILRLMGSLRYRTSYTQNQWQHAIEVGFLVGGMAGELRLNVKEARRAGFLHDLGKAVSHEVEGGHAVIGADLAKKYGESERVVHAIRAHHDDVKPETVLAHLVAAGDAISGARPGARSETLDSYVQRLGDLERISQSFPGVERSFAVQAGREIRVLVENSKVSDEGAVMLSRDIARKVEEELTYPGQIKITVIRETRAVGLAR